MEITSNSTKETKKLAKELAKKIKEGDTLALYGDLGSGKTTFVRFLVEALGIKSRVQSPTFIIARKYSNQDASNIKGVNHIDLYRFQTKDEVAALDLSELLNKENEISVIEWPEVAEDYLSERTIRIYYEYLGEDKRKIKVENI